MEEPETGHTCTIDYDSKLELKKMRPRYLNKLIDIYYLARYVLFHSRDFKHSGKLTHKPLL